MVEDGKKKQMTTDHKNYDGDDDIVVGVLTARNRARAKDRGGRGERLPSGETDDEGKLKKQKCPAEKGEHCNWKKIPVHIFWTATNSRITRVHSLVGIRRAFRKIAVS